jgi:protocatechuate 3,4-dioxygenase, beta subunit
MLQIILSLLLCYSMAACAQSNTQIKGKNGGQRVGGPCEGCEAIYESKQPFEALKEVDTLPTFSEEGPKLVISGTVYKSDGTTPAPGVVLYVYHTDQSGKYRVMGNEEGWGRRHGSIRGWIKTNRRGQYRFYTLRPASYSQTGPPAHIHVIVKEPDKNEYWIDDYHFDDDPFLTPQMRKDQRNRGGDGILKLVEKKGVYYGERSIYLGRNVSDYPTAADTRAHRGPVIGLVF